MSITISGKIERKGFGMGTWALVGDDGETYELKDAPEELRQSGIKAKVTGEIRKDVMTLAMIGQVLEVSSFETE
ncbi:hypothetical protein [Merismopedia glauca]|uniref:Uncharacterized protein n=1 Tax=Merismopedia glauca CCAP 1448/3 TaxID=1296344 RepID=A0A2T1C5F3_9CYAN|nr:hypothetical protein [Merismopedia glauca]PSB03353.1 hypothetical protein C7B64_08840 [Merismopedia glauca CCAP 1448/3]